MDIRGIKLPIIDKKPRKLYVTLFFLFIVSVISLVLSIFWDNKQLIDINIFCVVFFGIFTSYTRSYHTFGDLQFTDRHILINLKNTNEIIPYEKVKKIKLIFAEYEGEPFWLNPESISPKEGINNFIHIITIDKEYKHEVLLGSNTAITLKSTLKKWNSTQNIQVDIQNT